MSNRCKHDDMTFMCVCETDLGGWRFVHHGGEGFDRRHSKRVQLAFKDLVSGSIRQSTDMINGFFGTFNYCLCLAGMEIITKEPWL